ncbi:MAG TPA: hypothetical protein VNT26_20700 [Candidatus Sulfotelmatobacter sp.]|nr:hypothetical protein [Candidatus Sulfotelmatobacter sp.]
MSFGLWKVSSCLLLAACCGLVEGRVPGQNWRGRQIEFSGAKNSAVTNLDRSAEEKEGLKRLEKELNKSQPMFSPNSSLDGLQAPSYRPVPGPVIQNRRVKELIERRKNWMFANPEDLAPGSSLEETLRTPEFGADGLEKKKGPSLERFYESLDRPRTKGTREGAGALTDDPFGSRKRANGREDGSGRDDANLPGGLRDSEQALRKLLDADTGNSPFGGGAGRSSFSDFFGLGDNRRSLDQEQAHKDYITQYQQWLNGAQSAPGNSLNPLGAVDSARPTTPSPYNGLDTLSSPSRRSFDSTLGVINPNFNLGTLPDVNTKVLNQWNPLYTPPKYDPPKVTPPSPPPMEAMPRRRFM